MKNFVVFLALLFALLGVRNAAFAADTLKPTNGKIIWTEAPNGEWSATASEGTYTDSYVSGGQVIPVYGRIIYKGTVVLKKPDLAKCETWYYEASYKGASYGSLFYSPNFVFDDLYDTHAYTACPAVTPTATPAPLPTATAIPTAIPTPTPTPKPPVVESETTSLVAGGVRVGRYYSSVAKNPHQVELSATVEPIKGVFEGQNVLFQIASDHTGQSIQPGFALNGKDAPAASVMAQTDTSGVARAVLTSGSDVGTVSVRVTANYQITTQNFMVKKAEGDWDSLPIGTDSKGDPIVRLKLKFNGLPVNGHPISWSLKAVRNILDDEVTANNFSDFALLSGKISTTGASNTPGEAAAYLDLKPTFGRAQYYARDTAVSLTNSAIASLQFGPAAVGAATVAGEASYPDEAENVFEKDVIEDGDGRPKLKPLTKPLDEPMRDNYWEEFLEGGRLQDETPASALVSGALNSSSVSAANAQQIASDPERYEIVEIEVKFHVEADFSALNIVELSPAGLPVKSYQITDEGQKRLMIQALTKPQRAELMSEGVARIQASAEFDGNSIGKEFLIVLGEDYLSGAARDRVGYFGLGIVYAARDTVTGIWSIITNPKETYQGLASLADADVRSQVKKKMSKEMEKQLKDYQRSLVNGGNDAAMVDGRIVFELGSIVLGPKGSQYVVKAGKESKILKGVIATVPKITAKGNAKAVQRGINAIQQLQKGVRFTVGKIKPTFAGVSGGWSKGAVSPQRLIQGFLNNPRQRIFWDGNQFVTIIKQKNPFAYIINNEGVRVPCRFAKVFIGKDGKVRSMKVFSWVKLVCFTKGTPILMADGSHAAIEQIKIGDLVMSRDEATGATSAQRVVQTFEKQAAATLVLRLKNGEQIETTPEHPFYVESQSFTPAGEMGIGTSIVTRAGPSAVLASSEVRNQKATVYNFEVENTHTYFVGHSDLWVHNDCATFVKLGLNSFQYKWILNEANHFIRGTLNNKTGILNFVIIAKGESDVSAFRMFNEMLKRFAAEGKLVKIIRAEWSNADEELLTNLNQFNKAISQGKTIDDAARSTFTGTMAKRNGFTKIKSFYARQDDFGQYTEVIVEFTK